MGKNKCFTATIGGISLFIDIKGATYAYTDQGKGDVIVLLHGFTGRKETWNNFINKWQTSYRVIAIDLPGHGDTKTSVPRTMEMTIDDLRYIFKHLHIDRAHLLGYSMGGRTALAYALTYPETVKTLTLESSSPGLATEEARALRRENDVKLIARLENEGLKSFVDFWENIPLFVTQKQLPIEIQKNLRQERLSQCSKGLIQSLRYMGTGQQPSLWNNLQSFKRHVLLIVGQQDEKFVQLNEKMKQLLPYATLKIIEHAGHTVHLERPHKFLQEVTTFLEINNHI